MEQLGRVENEAAVRDGHAVLLGCVGSKGGQGASMFAACLAGLLSHEKRTILVDLDLNSTHRHLLDREDCPGISNLAMVIEEIPSLSLANIVQRHPMGFDLLPGLRLPEEDRLLSRVNLNLIFKLVSEIYDVVLLDVSTNHGLIAMGALLDCSLSFMIMHPKLLALRCAMRTIELAGRVEGQAIPWGLVVNQAKASDLVQPLQVSGVLEMPLIAVLPDDPAAGEDFSNFLKTGLRDTPYLAAIEQMAVRLRLRQGSTSTSNKSLPARCLRALRGRSQEPAAGRPGESVFLSGEGCSCTR